MSFKALEQAWAAGMPGAQKEPDTASASDDQPKEDVRSSAPAQPATTPKIEEAERFMADGATPVAAAEAEPRQAQLTMPQNQTEPAARRGTKFTSSGQNHAALEPGMDG